MVSTILVPLDGSALARHALPFATFMAQSTRARLVLVHA
jgi:nucleotide-binding universal stress UspA family protein